MFTKTILATVAAAVISAAGIAATTSAADAGYKGGYYITKYVSVPKKVCDTYYKDVITGYDYYNNPIYDHVAYEQCKTIYVTVAKKIYVPYVSYHSSHSYSYSSGY